MQKMPYFSQIVQTKVHSANILNNGEWKIIKWENTNKLLDCGFLGIKTGFTEQAGPCLASVFKSSRNSYILVVLNTGTKEDRWSDTCLLVDWVTQIYEK
jgi:D-alanyl-D-alanine carboxypeptidase